VTRQRDAVRDALGSAEGFRSAQELHDQLRHRGNPVGLTTVYRHLQQLADAGEVDVVRTASGESVYRRCAATDHHHHLVCRSCGSSVELSADEVEVWADRIAQTHGFSAVTHTVEMFGVCSGCADEPAQDSSSTPP
jgi:Fur family ferric uptake transcriptional regulator